MRINIFNDNLKIIVGSVEDNKKFNPLPKLNNKTNWGDYFVWLPKIIINNNDNKRYFVWLEVIQRRKVHWQLPGFASWSSYFYQYKLGA